MPRLTVTRLAGAALVLYGILGLLLAVLLLVIGYSTFQRVAAFSASLDAERKAVAQSVSTVSTTLADTNSGTTGLQSSIAGAQNAAASASQLAGQTATTFRGLAQGMNVQILGVQPFTGLAPQLSSSADDLQQLSSILGDTSTNLATNQQQVAQVGSDLAVLQTQLTAMSATLNGATAFGALPQMLLPFEVAYFGVCLLMILQALFSLVVGLALVRPVWIAARLGPRLSAGGGVHDPGGLTAHQGPAAEASQEAGAHRRV